MIYVEPIESQVGTLFQKPRWDFRSPNSEGLVPRWAISNRCLVINEISIRVMLDHIPSSVPPVIKDLRAQNVSANAPHRLIILVGKPLVTKFLGVKVMNLKRAMVDMRCCILAHEEAVVVHIIGTAIDVSKKRHVLLLAILLQVEEVSWNNVEVCGVEGDQVVKLLRANTKVSKLLI